MRDGHVTDKQRKTPFYQHLYLSKR